MKKQTEILIGIFIITVILAGGFFTYNKKLVPEKLKAPESPVVLQEKPLPELTISIPSKVEIVAYKPYLLNFSIKNERGHLEAKKVNITLSLDKTPILIKPNNTNIGPGESQDFEAKIDKLEPGDYKLYLKIIGKPKISISKTIPLKSQIVVGLDGYHTYNYYGSGSVWKKKFECGSQYLCTGRDYLFVKNLNDNNIKTIIIESQLSSEILKDINVLLILAPDINSPLLPDEITELKRFLNNNGGLLLIAPQYYTHTDDKNCITNLIKLAKSLNLKIKEFTLWYPEVGLYETQKEWTKEITQYPVTLGVEEILYDGVFTFEVEPPLISLVKLHGHPIYAIQYYSNGKIGIIGSDSVLSYGKKCHQCQKLHLNLIKWLATPEVYEERG